MTEMSKPVEEKRGEQLFRQAMKVYGIDNQEHVRKWRYFPPLEEGGERICLLTHGGEKVTYKEGDQPEKLEPYRIDGISRKKSKPLPGVGKARK